jgi:hypothetical protein
MRMQVWLKQRTSTPDSSSMAEGETLDASKYIMTFSLYTGLSKKLIPPFFQGVWKSHNFISPPSTSVAIP